MYINRREESATWIVDLSTDLSSLAAARLVEGNTFFLTIDQRRAKRKTALHVYEKGINRFTPPPKVDKNTHIHIIYIYVYVRLFFDLEPSIRFYRAICPSEHTRRETSTAHNRALLWRKPCILESVSHIVTQKLLSNIEPSGYIPCIHNEYVTRIQTRILGPDLWWRWPTKFTKDTLLLIQ